MEKFGRNWNDEEVEALCYAWVEEKTKPPPPEEKIAAYRIRLYENFKRKLPDSKRSEGAFSDKIDKLKNGLKFIIEYNKNLAKEHNDTSLIDKEPDVTCYKLLKKAKKRSEMTPKTFSILHPAFKSDPEFLQTSSEDIEIINLEPVFEVGNIKRHCENDLYDKLINKIRELHNENIKQQQMICDKLMFTISNNREGDLNQNNNMNESIFSNNNLDKLVESVFETIKKDKPNEMNEGQIKEIKSIVKGVLIRDKKDLKDKVIDHIKDLISTVTKVKEQIELNNYKKKKIETIEQVIRDSL